MSTTTEPETTVSPPPPSPPREAGSDQWVCLPATWEIYDALLVARGERARPKYTFVDERLTVVSPGHSHESLKTRLAALVDVMLDVLSIDFHASGEVSLLAARQSRVGNEPDASYYLTNIDRVVGKRDLVMGEDPAPDLVVEVVVSHPEADALLAYQRFGVREVWVCKGGALSFLVLGPEGRYEPSTTSALLPFLAAEELTPWVFRTDASGERPVRRQFRAWVEETLLPRHRPVAGH